MKKCVWALGVVVFLLALAEQASAGACLCVKRSADDRRIGFKCDDTTGAGGAAECQTSCQKAGYPFYDFKADMNCEALLAKKKDEKVTIELKPTITIPIPAVPAEIKINLSKIHDDLELPNELGGGKSYVKAEDYGSITVLIDKTADKDVYKLSVVEVDAKLPPIEVGPVSSGTITETLNKSFVGGGELNVKTGDIWLLFSGLLSAESFPGSEATSYTLYTGQCFGCLEGGAFQMQGDSIYFP